MFKISFQRMGAHARFAKLCAVGGVAASFALVKVEYIVKIDFDPDLQGVEKRREGKLLLTERGFRGSTSTDTRKPAWQVG